MPLKSIIAELSKDIVERGQSPSWREAARATGGVPVYEDMSGILVIAADGEILFYDTEAESTKPVTGEFRRVAEAHASRLYAELADMAPVRPTTARECSLCGGNGVREGHTICGQCWGVGWVEQERLL